MTIESIGTGLKTLLDTISGLKVYSLKEIPDKVSTPAVVMALGETAYRRAFGSTATADLTIRVIVLLGKADLPSAADRMLDYIEESGSSSIVAKVEGDTTLDGSCQAAIVTRNLGLGVTNWGGIDYLSTEFEIDIWT